MTRDEHGHAEPEGETRPWGPYPVLPTTDPERGALLLRNLGDGTFEDVVAAAGVTNERFDKGWPGATTTTAGPTSTSPTWT